MARRRKPSRDGGALIIRGADIVTVDDAGRILRGDIRVEAGRIVAVAPRLRPQPSDRVIDAKGLVAMPGLVQAHVHVCQTLFRGLPDGDDLLTWLRATIWPLEGAMSAADVRDAARLGLAELLLGGTTAILDMGTVHHTDAIFTAARALGMRYTGGKTIMDRGQGIPAGLRESTAEAIEDSVRLCEKWHGRAGGRLRYAFSPRFALASTEAGIRACVAEARARGALLHTHAAENSEEVQLIRARIGQSNIEYLHALGMTGADVVLAHCVWLSLGERRLLAETGTHVAHCPSANLKLGSGIARVPDYLADGIGVAIGTDGAACNDRLDGFAEMRLCALLHKARGGAAALPAATALRMATRGGARALGLADVGSLAPGQRADIILLDLNSPHASPPGGDLIARIVYAARAADVHTVLVDGRVVVREGELESGKLSTILGAAKRAATRLRKRVE